MEIGFCPYCEEYEFTINRADQIMVSKKEVGIFYNIAPDDLWELIEVGLLSGILRKVWASDDKEFVEVMIASIINEERR